MSSIITTIHGQKYELVRSCLSAAWGDMDDEQFAMLTLSMKNMGQVFPIMVLGGRAGDAHTVLPKRIVLDGWHRLMAAHELGTHILAVFCVNGLTTYRRGGAGHWLEATDAYKQALAFNAFHKRVPSEVQMALWQAMRGRATMASFLQEATGSPVVEGSWDAPQFCESVEEKMVRRYVIKDAHRAELADREAVKIKAEKVEELKLDLESAEEEITDLRSDVRMLRAELRSDIFRRQDENPL